jgi:hypothetical protein
MSPAATPARAGAAGRAAVIDVGNNSALLLAVAAHLREPWA